MHVSFFYFEVKKQVIVSLCRPFRPSVLAVSALLRSLETLRRRMQQTVASIAVKRGKLASDEMDDIPKPTHVVSATARTPHHGELDFLTANHATIVTQQTSDVDVLSRALSPTQVIAIDPEQAVLQCYSSLNGLRAALQVTQLDRRDPRELYQQPAYYAAEDLVYKIKGLCKTLIFFSLCNFM